MPEAPAPLSTWQTLPFSLAENVAASFAPEPVKTLFRLWGETTGEVSRDGLVYTVEPDDPSVSTAFSAPDGAFTTLSLSGDGLALSITTRDESSVTLVPADEIGEVWRYEAWSELIVLR